MRWEMRWAGGLGAAGLALAPPAAAQERQPPWYTFESTTPAGEPGHFTIYYRTEGAHRVAGAETDTDAWIDLVGQGEGCQLTAGGGPPTYGPGNGPDYVETLACYMEFSLERLVELGFGGGEVPPEMGRVFIVEYDTGGTSMPLNIPLLSGDILIDANQTDAKLRTLSTHELFHQFQYTYTTHLRAWWLLEGTATWSEDLTFESQDRYTRHINEWFEEPQMGLYTASYAAVAFWRYLTEQYGPQHPELEVSTTLMQELWRQLAREGSGAAAVTRTLAALGYEEDFERVFLDGFMPAAALKDLPLDDPRLQFDEAREAAYAPTSLIEPPGALAAGGGVQVGGEALPPWAVHYRRYALDPSVGAVSASVEADAPVALRLAVISADGHTAILSGQQGTSFRLDAPPLSGATDLWVMVSTLHQSATYRLDLGASPGPTLLPTRAAR